MVHCNPITRATSNASTAKTRLLELAAAAIRDGRRLDAAEALAQADAAWRSEFEACSRADSLLSGLKVSVDLPY